MYILNNNNKIQFRNIREKANMGRVDAGGEFIIPPGVCLDERSESCEFTPERL